MEPLIELEDVLSHLSLYALALIDREVWEEYEKEQKKGGDLDELRRIGKKVRLEMRDRLS